MHIYILLVCSTYSVGDIADILFLRVRSMHRPFRHHLPCPFAPLKTAGSEILDRALAVSQEWSLSRPGIHWYLIRKHGDLDDFYFHLDIWNEIHGDVII